jgi:hypothetical protein
MDIHCTQDTRVIFCSALKFKHLVIRWHCTSPCHLLFVAEAALAAIAYGILVQNLDAPAGLIVTAGEDNLTKYNHRSPGVHRFFCKTCGTHAYMTLDDIQCNTTCPSLFPKMPFKPICHIHCESAADNELLAAIKDGLPRYRDMPEDFGGTGELLEADTSELLVAGSTGNSDV